MSGESSSSKHPREMCANLRDFTKTLNPLAFLAAVKQLDASTLSTDFLYDLSLEPVQCSSRNPSLDVFIYSLGWKWTFYVGQWNDHIHFFFLDFKTFVVSFFLFFFFKPSYVIFWFHCKMPKAVQRNIKEVCAQWKAAFLTSRGTVHAAIELVLKSWGPMGGRLDKWDSTCSRSKAAADINQRLHSIFRKTFSLFLNTVMSLGIWTVADVL